MSALLPEPAPPARFFVSAIPQTKKKRPRMGVRGRRKGTSAPCQDIRVHEPANKHLVLWVYSGRECAGFLLPRGKSGVEAFTAASKSLGIFATQKAAADALLTRRAAS
jgi:hypothetical protein